MGGRRKPWLELAGEPVLLHALRPFLEHPLIVAVRVALDPEDAADPPPWLADLDERVAVVAGGDTRTLSVREAVRALPGDVEDVMVHDAARPLVTVDMIERCRATLHGVGAAGPVATDGVVVGWPVVDTLKEVDGSRQVVDTPDRSRFWQAQTPQAFQAAPFRRALERLEALPRGGQWTDDASVAEAAGLKVVMVEGAPWNLKVTRPDDLTVAELLLGMRS